jgi:hypothetical protein
VVKAFPITMHILTSWAWVCQGHATHASSVRIEVPKPLVVNSVSATHDGKPLRSAAQTSPELLVLPDLDPNISLDLQVTLADGRIIQGVNLQWFAPVDKGNPDALTDDDRTAIGSLIRDVDDFYNRKDLLLLSGNADRATALVRLVRDTDFESGKGQIVCRIEIWYFENQAGGWAAVRQQKKIVRRDRFKDARTYQTTMAPLRFVETLGGVSGDREKTKVIALTESDINAAPSGYAAPPATQPKERPAG